MAFAKVCAEAATRELHVLAVEEVDEPGGIVEIARLELARSDEGEWHLQYVSHPALSMGLTTLLSPSEGDLRWRAHPQPASETLPIIEAFSSDELCAQGLCPVARVDLRAANAFPIVPTVAEAAHLNYVSSAAVSFHPEAA